MEGIPEAFKKFGSVTVGAVIVSSLLWWSAGSIAAYSGNFYAYIIIAILAGLAQTIALFSAKKEGLEYAGK